MPTEQQYNEYKKLLILLGVKEGSTEMTRLMREFMSGHKGGSNNNNGNSANSRSGETGVERTYTKVNPNKGLFPNNPAEVLDQAQEVYERIMTNPNSVSAAEVRALQQQMVDMGLNIDFKSKDGTMRRGQAAVDGRWGNSSGRAFEIYTALLNAAQSNAFDEDWRAKHGNNVAPRVKVAGSNPATANQMRNAYYAYFKAHPEIYAGILQNPDKHLAWNSLPYLDDAARELLYDLVMQFNQNLGDGQSGWDDSKASQDARYLNYHQMAQLGLFNPANNNAVMAADAGKNVSEAMDRAGRNIYNGTMWAMGTGQRLAGATANSIWGDQPTEWDMVFDPNTAYELVLRYNPITNKREFVTVPSKKQAVTVADVAGIENGVGRFVVNTITDPLFLLGGGAKAISQLSTNTVKGFRNFTNNVARNRAHGFKNTMQELEAARIEAIMSKDPAKVAQIERQMALVKEFNPGLANVNDSSRAAGAMASTTGKRAGRGSAKYTGQMGIDEARQAGLKVMETPETAEVGAFIIKPNRAPINSTIPYGKIDSFTPYIAPPTGGYIDYSLPYWQQEFPGGKVDWVYNPADDSGNMYEEFWNGDGSALSSTRSSNSNNFWRYQSPLSGSYNAYYGGQSQYNRAKEKSKKNKKDKKK